MARASATQGRRRAEARRRTFDPAPYVRAAWLVAAALGVAALVLLRLVDAAGWAAPAAAGYLSTVYAAGLAGRSGGRVLPPTLLVAALAALTVVTRWPILLGGAAAGTAVLAGALAIMVTMPAATYRRAIVEVLIATAVATGGGLAVAGYGGRVDTDRLAYVVLGGTLFAAFALVYRLGAGFHGLGTRGYILAGGALVVLVVALVYTAALGRWGSPEMVGAIQDLRVRARDALHGVPHPIEVLLGVPALTWGVFMRARRRQGWWVCAFGAAATAPAATRFVERVGTEATVLSAGYSLVLGLALGYLVIRVEQTFTGSRGRRARRTEEAAAHRPEPGRLHPLR